MTFLVELVEFFVVLCLALTFIGFGITRLLLPASLRQWRWLVMPLIGYCVALLFFRILHASLLTGVQCTWVLLFLAALINLLAILRRRYFAKGLASKETLFEMFPALIAILIFIVATMPLLTYGYSTIIGVNGDVDFYLGSGEYFKDYSGRILSIMPETENLALLAPTSAFLGEAWSAATHVLGGAGCSYILSMAATLLQWTVLQSFAPTLAFFTALSALAFYLFNRTVLSLSKPMSVFAALLLGLNGLILWTAFFNYGHQMSVLPLLPLGVVALQAAYEHLNWRSFFLLALVFCALVICYWAATLWFIGAAILFLVLTVSTRRRVPNKAYAVVAVLVVACIPIAITMPRYVRTIAERIFSQQGESIFEQYFSIRHVFGLEYFVWPEPFPVEEWLGSDLAPVFGSSVPILFGIAILLCMAGLWYAIRKKNFVVISIIIVSGVFIAGTQFVTQDTYGNLRAIVFAVFVAISMAVWGLEISWKHIGQNRYRWINLSGRAALGIIALALLTVNGVNAYMTVGSFATTPQSSYSGKNLDISEVKSILPPNASVFITNDARLQGFPMSPISYSLYPHPQNGWTGIPNWPQRTIGRINSPVSHILGLSDTPEKAFEPNLSDFAVLSARENPLAKGYQSEHLIWGNEAIRVYEKGSIVAHVDFDRGHGGWAISDKQHFQTILGFPEEQTASMSTGSASSGKSPEYSLVFEYSSLVDQQVNIDLDGKKLIQQVTPGLWHFQAPAVTLPISVTITTASTDPLLLHWVQLRNEATAEPQLEQVDSYCLVRSSSLLKNQGLEKTLQWLGPKLQQLPGSLEVSIRKADSQFPMPPFVKWIVDDKLRETKIELDKEKGLVKAFGTDPTAAPVVWKPEQGDGYYLAEVRSIFAEANDESYKFQPWAEIFRFAVQDGKVIDIQSKDGPLMPRYVPLDTWYPVEAAFGDAAMLRGYSINTDLFRTDRDAEISLYWDVPKGFARDWSISVQLVDAQGKSWNDKLVSLMDAQPFQDNWSEIETLKTNIALPIGRNVPGGQYQLRVLMYYASTGDSLSVRAPGRDPSNALMLGPYTVKPPVYLEGR